jgi:Pretoxin HINT domain
MKRFFSILTLISLLNSYMYAYNNVDSLATTIPTNAPKMDSLFSKLLSQSSLALQEMLERNNSFTAQGKHDSLQFVLNLNFDIDANADVPYFNQKVLNFVTEAKGNNLNLALKAIHTNRKVAPYLLFVTLNYKLDVKINDNLTIKDIVDYDKVIAAGKKVEEVEFIKDLHQRLTIELENQLPKTANDKWVFVNVGNYESRQESYNKNTYVYKYKFKNLESGVGTSIDKLLEAKLVLLKDKTKIFAGTKDDFADVLVDILDNSIGQAQLKEKILSIITKDELCQFFLNNALFPVNSDKGYVSESYKILSLEERKHCLKLLIGADWINVACINKPTILALLRNTPQQDIPAIFSFLKEKVPNNYNNRGKSYIYLLIANTSDGLFSSDYTDLLKIFTKLFELNPELNDKAKALALDINAKRNATVSFGVNIDKQAIGSISFDAASINQNGEITVSKKSLVKIIYISRIVAPDVIIDERHPDLQPYGTSIYDPFELVIFTSYTNLAVVDDNFNTTSGEEIYVPAVFLPYVVDKKVNDQITTGVVMAIDIATLATGVGAVPGLFVKGTTWGRRAWVAFDMANSAVNLGINLSGLANDPNYRKMVSNYNLLVGAIGGTKLLTDGLQLTKNFGSVIKEGNLEGSVKSTNIEQQINDFNDASNALLADTRLNNAQRNEIKRLQKLVADCTGTYCFIAGTLIATNKTKKKIEQITEGDTVLSRDLTTNQNVLQKVVRTFTKVASKLVRLITNRDTIFATPEHPFYAVDVAPDGSNQGNWMSAGSLKKGIKVLLASGMLANVESAFAFDTTVTVYNFEVEKTHNYFVGNEGVLVHNVCRPVPRNVNDILTLPPSLPNNNNWISKATFERNADRYIVGRPEPLLERIVDDIKRNGDALDGTKTELICDHIFENYIGLRKLNGKYGSNNGFDGIYIEGSIENPTRIIIVEAKQWDDGVSLNKAVMKPDPSDPTKTIITLPKQMSDDWIDHVSFELYKTYDPDKIAIHSMIQQNKSKIVKIVAAVNPNDAAYSPIYMLRLGENVK